MENSLLILPLWLCALFSWSLGVNILALKKYPEFRAFAFGVISIGLYCGGYGGELYSSALGGMLFWSKLQYVGIAFIPAFWVDFTFRYTGREDLLKSDLKYVLWGFPLVTIFFKLFDGSACLIYKNVSIAPLYKTLQFAPGPWYYVQVAYSYLCGFSGIVFLIRFGRKRMGIHRKNVAILIVAAILPIIADFVYESPESPFGRLDLVPFALVLSMLIFYVAVLRNDLLNLVPVAREFAFEYVPQGILVFDKRRRLCDANESARALLALGSDCIGENASDIFTLHFARKTLPDSGKTVFETSINGRNLEIRTNIVDKADTRLGWIVTLVDIGKRKRMEEKLERLLKNRSVPR